MIFDEEWNQAINEMTLEELEATKATLEKAYADVNQLILKSSAASTISAMPDRWRLHRN